MASVLRAGGYLISVLIALSLLLLLVGLGMAARPESFISLGFRETAKTGMVIALIGGVGAIGGVLLNWVLKLLRSSLTDQDEAG